MQLEFLGTGPARPIPRPGHLDALCLAAEPGSKSRRTRSAVLVSEDVTRILVDAGPDVTLQLERAAPRRIDAVFLTHGHADAASGLSKLDRWLTDLGAHDVPLLTDPVTRTRLETRFPRLATLELLQFEPLVELALQGLHIRPFPVRHARDARFPTFGFLFTSVGSDAIAYASDMFALGPGAAALLEGVDTLIADAAMYLGQHMPTHQSPEAAILLAARLGSRRLVLTQLGHGYPAHESAEAAIRAYRRTLPHPRPERVLLAYDGLVLRS
jgi:phosphoribosyl 1,2-cyclic phosphate phosphodiesterase